MSKPNQSLSMLHTVAAFSPNDVNLLASKYGYLWPGNSDDERLAFLCAFVEDKDDRGWMEIAAIHPDRKLIAAAVKAKKEKKNKKISAADGSPQPQITSPQPVIINQGFSEGTKLLLLVASFVALIYFIHTSKS